MRRRPLPAELEILPVTDLKSFETCVATADRGFGGKKVQNDRWREVYMGLGFGPTKRWFTGFLNGKPVASSLLLLHGGLATVWIVATRRMARGRGIGTAMTCEAMLLARELGYDFIVIQASKMGLPVYKKIGFVEYGKVRTYTWKPGVPTKRESIKSDPTA